MRHAVYPGVDLKKFLGEDVIPPYEEHTARLERGLSLDAWGRMGKWEKALLIAQRRIENAVANLQSEAQIDASKKNLPKGKR